MGKDRNRIMNRHWMWTTAVGLAVLATGLSAQEPAQPAPAPKARRAAPAPEARAFSFTYAGNRGRIGVIVNTAANAETDKAGARIDGITPGGPAEKAGLKAGDIITKFNGTPLAGVSAEEEDQSGPGTKLIELAHALDPGDTVKVEYRRGNDVKAATFVAEAVKEPMAMIGPDQVFVEPRMAMPRTPMPMMGDREFSFCFGDSWCDLDLVKLNPDLGDYFGTREGILVVKAPADSGLPLKGGDVILAIGGRKPTSPAHAMRILRSYEPGESVTIDVLRKQKRVSLSYKVPEARHSWWRGGSDNDANEQSLRRALEDAQSAWRTAQRQFDQGLRQQINGETLRQQRQQLERSLRAVAAMRRSVSL